jgi:hypothetical protein
MTTQAMTSFSCDDVPLLDGLQDFTVELEQYPQFLQVPADRRGRRAAAAGAQFQHDLFCEALLTGIQPPLRGPRGHAQLLGQP